MTGWQYPRLIAHRCGGALAPENTLAGLVIAARLGVRAVEFDVMLSADGVPVLIHDETLERTTNGRGRVADTPFQALQTLDAGSYQHPGFADERIPSLAAALALCDQLNLAVNLEVKPASGHEAVTGATAAALAASALPRAGLIVSSFSTDALAAARDAAPMLPRALLVEAIPDDWSAQLQRYGCEALHASAWQLEPAKLQAIRATGIPLACYTVNQRAQAEALFAAGIVAVFSDRPDVF